MMATTIDILNPTQRLQCCVPPTAQSRRFHHSTRAFSWPWMTLLALSYVLCFSSQLVLSVPLSSSTGMTDYAAAMTEAAAENGGFPAMSRVASSLKSRRLGDGDDERAQKFEELRQERPNTYEDDEMIGESDNFGLAAGAGGSDSESNQLLTPGQLRQVRFLGQDEESTRNSLSDKNDMQQLMTDEDLGEGSDDGKISGGVAGAAADLDSQQWEIVTDPKYFIQTERETSPSTGTTKATRRQQQQQQQQQQQLIRSKRNAGPSLSIVNPLDVLRQRLLIEIARRRFHSKNQQIHANTEYLSRIGKRRR